MLVFLLAVFTLVRFALGSSRLAGGSRAATGMLWAVVVLTALLALTRAFAQEREHGIWDGLLGAPVERWMHVGGQGVLAVGVPGSHPGGGGAAVLAVLSPAGARRRRSRC